jgi:GH25 family lysozyme M1 (1,4-beta-N-acetylmuramidase)
MVLWRMVTVCTMVLAFSLVTAAGAGAVTWIRGIDVSSYQHVGRTINWQLVSRSGIRFAAIKASEGTYYTNPYYAGDARAAAAAGLSVVPYVFANPGSAPGAATARFGVAAAGYARTGLPVEVDLENDPYAAGHCYGLSVRQMIAWIAAFTAQATALTGKAPIVYTSAQWWRQCTKDTALFRNDSLWLASYDTATPGVPSPWKQWTFWQYDDDTMVPGVGLTDVDFYRATTALSALPADAVRTTRRPPQRQ